jgi:hypothetical protein
VFVAPLAGENRGTIDNVHVLSGTVGVSSTSLTGVLAGGLVGQNKGAITNSVSAANVTVGNGGVGGTNVAGGLVGINVGSIASSSASGTILGGFNSSVGGLAGQNGGGPGANSITSSFATGNVTGNGGVGGLVGFGTANSTITGSHASGNVIANAVVGGTNASGGGLVGQNQGLIETSFYNTGTVSGTGTGALNVPGTLSVSLGGLVGANFNGATVRDSNATAIVTGTFGNFGGLVGNNFGTITGTSPGQVFANATVTVGGAHSSGGALVGTNGNGGTIFNANATGTVAPANATVLSKLGGLVGQNDGSVDHSTANVTVTGGVGSAGGLVGQNDATITFSSASGNVTGTAPHGFAEIGSLVGSNNSNGEIAIRRRAEPSPPASSPKRAACRSNRQHRFVVRHRQCQQHGPQCHPWRPGRLQHIRRHHHRLARHRQRHGNRERPGATTGAGLRGYRQLPVRRGRRPGRAQFRHDPRYGRSGGEPGVRRRPDLRHRRGQRRFQCGRRRARRVERRHHHLCVCHRRGHRRGGHQQPQRRRQSDHPRRPGRAEHGRHRRLPCARKCWNAERRQSRSWRGRRKCRRDPAVVRDRTGPRGRQQPGRRARRRQHAVRQ